MSRIIAMAAVLAVACQSCSKESAHQQPAEGTPAATAAAPPAATDGPVLVHGAANGDIAAYVATETRRGTADGYRTLVYVGATWCEPCKYFKQAVASGALQADFGDLRILEFDSDRDDARLSAAGYGSMMIPLFVVPGPDGHGSEVRMAGGTKGPDSAALLVPRLQALLDEPAAQ